MHAGSDAGPVAGRDAGSDAGFARDANHDWTIGTVGYERIAGVGFPAGFDAGDDAGGFEHQKVTSHCLAVPAPPSSEIDLAGQDLALLHEDGPVAPDRRVV